MGIFDSVRNFFTTKQEDLPLETFGPLVVPKGTNKFIGDTAKSILQSTIRSIPEAGMSLLDVIKNEPVKQIEIPKNPVANFFLGTKPLETIQQRTPEFAKEYNVPMPLALGAVGLGTALDLPGPGIIKNLFKESAEKVVTRLAKDIGKEGAAFTVKELSEKVPQSFLKQLIKEGGIETATHTISYDPVRKFIDIIPKVVEDIKPELKASAELVPKVAGIRTKVETAKNTVEEAKNLAKGTAQVAQEQRAVFDPDMINLAKKLAKTKSYAEGDVETLRTIKNGEYGTFISDLTEKVRSLVDPAMSDSDAFKYVSELPSKAETAVKQSGIKVAQQELDMADAELKNAIKGKGVRVYKEGADGIAPAKRQLKSTFNDTMDLADKTLDESLNAGKATGFGVGPDDFSKSEAKGFASSLNDVRESLPGTKVSLRGEATVPSEVFAELKNVKPVGSKTWIQSTTRNFQSFLGKGSASEKWINDGLKAGTQSYQNYIKESLARIKPLFEGMTKAEKEAVTLFGEGSMTAEELATKFPTKFQQIMNADAEARKIFDETFNLVNDSRQRINLDPINYQKNYYSIMEDTSKQSADMMGNLADVRGYSVKKNSWATKFAGFLKSRKPEAMVENRLLDAQEILDSYIRSAGYQINITPIVERMNTLAKEGRKVSTTMPDNAAITGYINFLEERANLLAGRKSAGEMSLPPVVNDFLKTIRGYVGRNLVTKSPTSGFTNLVPLVKYVAPEVGPENLAMGMKRAITMPLTELNNFTIDGIQSQFLRNRYEVPGLTETWVEKLANAEFPIVGFEKLDKVSSNIAFYAFQNKFLKEGKDLAEATKLADESIARILTDRSLGQLPQLITEKGLTSLFTMFLPERLNEALLQYGDTITGLKGPQKLKALSNFLYYTIAGLAINQLSTALFGRPFTDSIATGILDTVNQHSETDSAFDTAGKFIVNEASQYPGTELLAGGSKLPITAGFPTLRQATEEPLMAAAKFGSIYADPTGISRPILRVVEGLLAMNKGFVGSNQVKYPVPQDAINQVKMLLLGTSATNEAREYYDRNYTPLSDKESLAYETIYRQGNDDQAYLLWKALDAKKYINSPLNKLSALEVETTRLLSKATTEEERNAITKRFLIMVQKAASEAQSRAKEVVPEIQEVSNKLPLTSSAPSRRTAGVKVSTGSTGLKKPTLKVPKLSLSIPKSTGIKTSTPSIASLSPITPYQSNSKLSGLRVRQQNA